MVGRRTLDGLRKGKKDVYALNAQYVKRSSDSPTVHASKKEPLRHDCARRVLGTSIVIPTDGPCSDFLKRDDQTLVFRLQQEERLDATKKAAVESDRARAFTGQNVEPRQQERQQPQHVEEDVTMDDAEEEIYGSRTIVIHVGSQNLRIGLATDALPKTIPMVIARKSERSETQLLEPRPKRVKTSEGAPSEQWFGDEVRAFKRSIPGR